MATESTTAKPQRYRTLDAWDALIQRDVEYGLNLLVGGEWVVDGLVKDSFSSLDARVGSERCQETAALALFLRRIVIDFLKEEGLDKEFSDLIADYRVKHANDKDWNTIFNIEDVHLENAPQYDVIKQAIIDKIGSKWATFLGLARTLTLFSVLTPMEAGMPIRYRRKNDVLVETSKAQRGTGMGEYHDIEFAMRMKFTALSFDLIERVANTVLGEKAVPFDDEPRPRSHLLEQAREMFHFSKAFKINPGHKEYPITVGSFSASTIILIYACYHYNIPITECMPRLKYHGPIGAAHDEPAEQTDYEALEALSLDDPTSDTSASTTYTVTAAPVFTYFKSKANGGCYQLVKPDEYGIENEPSWKLGGFSMYNMLRTGSLLSSSDDAEYVTTLKQNDATHRLTIFGFFHNEYPAATENGGIDLVTLINKVCGAGASAVNVTLQSIEGGLKLDINNQTETISFLSLAAACSSLARQHNLHDTFLAYQRDPLARSAYRMQNKPIPYTYNHIEISTFAHEEEKWGKLLEKFNSTEEPIYSHIFTIGNAAYSIDDQTEADALMRINNDNQKIKRLRAAHPNHAIYLTDEHRAKWDASTASAPKSGKKQKKAGKASQS